MTTPMTATCRVERSAGGPGVRYKILTPSGHLLLDNIPAASLARMGYDAPSYELWVADATATEVWVDISDAAHVGVILDDAGANPTIIVRSDNEEDVLTIPLGPWLSGVVNDGEMTDAGRFIRPMIAPEEGRDA